MLVTIVARPPDLGLISLLASRAPPHGAFRPIDVYFSLYSAERAVGGAGQKPAREKGEDGVRSRSDIRASPAKSGAGKQVHERLGPPAKNQRGNGFSLGGFVCGSSLLVHVCCGRRV